MAFVILSAGGLTRSSPRSLSMRAVVSIVLAGTLVVLAVGIALGYGFGRAGWSDLFRDKAVQVEAQEVVEQTADNRMLIDRFGELSGRMLQLEAEAMDLAFRIGVIKNSENKGEPLVADKPGRVAKTPPGSPSGGPLLSPGETGWAPSLSVPEAEPAELTDDLSRLEASIRRVAELMTELDRAVVALNLAYMARPGREPVRGHAVISSFGNRLDPFTKRRAFHSGIDYPAPKGTPILASAGGRVIFSGYRSQYGNTIEIDHGGGLVTRYAHASALVAKVGQVVMPGELIAKVGSTGRSTGPHLHFEILRDGRFVDPTVYLAQF